jgi:hypothetical protein
VLACSGCSPDEHSHPLLIIVIFTCRPACQLCYFLPAAPHVNCVIFMLFQGQLNTHMAAYLPSIPPAAARPAAAAANGDSPSGPGSSSSSSTADLAAIPLPAYAGWFCYNKVHLCEQAAVPDFFSGKYPGNTPQVGGGHHCRAPLAAAVLQQLLPAVPPPPRRCALLLL